MKKLIVIACVAVFGSASLVRAEDASTEESKFRVGPAIGLNASTFTCTSCESIGVKGAAGFAGGGVAEILFNKYLAVEFAALYLQKGAEIRPGSTKTADLNFTTLEIPVSLKGRFGNNKVKGVVFGGPQIGFALTRQITPVGGAAQDLKTKSLDYGVHVGGGAEFTLAGHYILFVNGRINIGLADLDNGQIGQSTKSFGVLALGGMKFGF